MWFERAADAPAVASTRCTHSNHLVFICWAKMAREQNLYVQFLMNGCKTVLASELLCLKTKQRSAFKSIFPQFGVVIEFFLLSSTLMLCGCIWLTGSCYILMIFGASSFLVKCIRICGILVREKNKHALVLT